LPAQPTKAAHWYAARLAQQQAWAWPTPGCDQNEPLLIEETGALPQRATQIDSVTQMKYLLATFEG
jgi:hypothetical protein